MKKLFILCLGFALFTVEAQKLIRVGYMCTYPITTEIKSVQIPIQITIFISKEGIVHINQYNQLPDQLERIRSFKQEYSPANDRRDSRTYNTFQSKEGKIEQTIGLGEKEFIVIWKVNGVNIPVRLLQTSIRINNAKVRINGSCESYSVGLVPRTVINVAKDDYLYVREKPMKNSIALAKRSNSSFLWKTQPSQSGDWVQVAFLKPTSWGGFTEVKGYVYKKYLSTTLKWWKETR